MKVLWIIRTGCNGPGFPYPSGLTAWKTTVVEERIAQDAGAAATVQAFQNRSSRLVSDYKHGGWANTSGVRIHLVHD
ncbi:MAG: hypothetical protein RJR37_08895 [Peptococcaceae bacterium MAG4]|jgi:hypothetical protein|nr:hypothetical protein [Peptococcaceae bacterium MAG4]